MANNMSPELQRLIEMHTYKRPAGSSSERQFIARYISSLGAVADEHDNYMLVIGDSPKHVWSSHTDTVHHTSGRQRVRLRNGILRARGSAVDCLGADDTAGVWLMCEMIRRKVTGRYLFHFGEEKGCIGSRELVHSNPTWLDDTEVVIALDRRDDFEVITHQCGSRTASRAFARALARGLNRLDSNFGYAPSDRGLYTDSESYAEDVAECTNLGVGYSGAHGNAESLDTTHALRLLDALTLLDVSALPIKRKPESGWISRYCETATYVSGAHDDTFWNSYTDRTVDVNSADYRRASGLNNYCDWCGRFITSLMETCPDCDEPNRTFATSSGYLHEDYEAIQKALREQAEYLRANHWTNKVKGNK